MASPFNRALVRMFALVLLVLGALACTREVMVVVTPTPDPSMPPPTASVPTPFPTASALPSSTPAPAAQIFKVGIVEDVTSHNFWSLFGPSGTSWNFYVFLNRYPFMYTQSDQRFDWIPSIAEDFPTAFVQEGDQWTTTSKVRQGFQWSDGEPITAHDVVFTINTVLDMEMVEGNWSFLVDPESVVQVEAVDDYTVKYFFTEPPGLSQWQYGLSGLQFVARHFWEPLVNQVRSADATMEEQREALYAIVPENEPTAGEMVLAKWEQGAFVQVDANELYPFAGTIVTEYANGAYMEEKPGEYSFTAYGEPSGEKTLEFTRGPHVSSVIFSVYPDQDAAVLALQAAEIDYILNPNGLQRGFQKQLQKSGVQLQDNPSNSVRYLGFNTRREPMNHKEFRQAVSVLIDKEFVANAILQGTAHPTYSMVPPGNGIWHNADVPELGKGMSREERIQEAVRLLKSAGFTWEVEPAWDPNLRAAAPRGQGLRTPNGEIVGELELLAPSAGYDPLRSTFAIWTEQWLNEVGIPTKVELTGLNAVNDRVMNEQDMDMWILGWTLSIFPDYLYYFFSSDTTVKGAPNAGGYSNPDFDELAFELVLETDIEEAQAKAFRLQEILAEESTYVVLFSPQVLEAYRADVQFPYDTVLGGLKDYFQNMNGPLATTSID